LNYTFAFIADIPFEKNFFNFGIKSKQNNSAKAAAENASFLLPKIKISRLSDTKEGF